MINGCVPQTKVNMCGSLTMCLMIFIAMGFSSAHAEDLYRKPPQIVVDMLDAPPAPGSSVSPNGKTMLLLDRLNMPSLSDLAQPMLRLAGSRINPATNGRFLTSYNTGFTLLQIDGGETFSIELPENVKLSSPVWSPDGEKFAFTNTTEEGVELWVGYAKTMRARKLTEPKLNATSRAPFVWLPDSRNLVCSFVLPQRGEAPQAALTPAGPVIEESRGRVSPVRTYQDLLTNAHDETLFDYYFSSELFLLDTKERTRRKIGEAALYSSISPSPDGSYLLVSKIVTPYSYRVTARSFPTVVEMWDMEGRLVKRIAELPLRDTTPIGGVPTGPRSFQWRAHENTAELIWVEALDGGNPRNKVSHRDKLMRLEAPFDDAPEEIARTEHRFTSLTWIQRTTETLLSEYDRDKRWTRTWRVNLGLAGSKPKLVWSRSVNDRYGDPGRVLTTTNKAGRSIAILRNGNIFLAGRGATPKGDLPFLDRVNLLTLVKDRPWQCEEGFYEYVIDILPGNHRFLTSRESPEVPQNFMVHDQQSGRVIALTDFRDPTPQIRGITKQLVTYERADGVMLSATLYLPADYQEGQRLPLVVWAYPREFNNAATAGQVSGSPYRFTRLRGTSHLFFLTQGYAIMDGATMPVIGDPENMNDSFIEQIVSSARAAIDKAAQMGVADPNRVGVGGHSYGAFMTGNLLAHCDLFKAGIARSGAYNRTLTPFGFQSERRTLWEAPMAYFKVSPFMHADKINEPILLIHGEKDNNSGTFPIQSQRMFHALKGHGATARLVMLPFESHGYRARESVMHVLAEMIDWFDEHVKGTSAAPYNGQPTGSE